MLRDLQRVVIVFSHRTSHFESLRHHEMQNVRSTANFVSFVNEEPVGFFLLETLESVVIARPLGEYCTKGVSKILKFLDCGMRCGFFGWVRVTWVGFSFW